MAIAVDSFAYRACQKHKVYPKAVFAKTAVKLHRQLHRQGVHRCRKCLAGRVYKVWKCDAMGAVHWHTGHGDRVS